MWSKDSSTRWQGLDTATPKKKKTRYGIKIKHSLVGKGLFPSLAFRKVFNCFSFVLTGSHCVLSSYDPRQWNSYEYSNEKTQ